jgi:death-on-curing protein
MEILIDEDTLIAFHEILVSLYKQTEYPITLGYSEGMVQVCIERPITDIYNFIPFPQLLHKATILMETIINFHPFVDGNKRVALLATYFFLYWNGYDLIIPEDAADFTIDIAKGTYNLNDIYLWLSYNSIRNFRTILRNKMLSMYLSVTRENPIFQTITAAFILPMFFTMYPFLFFRYLIRKKPKK